MSIAVGLLVIAVASVAITALWWSSLLVGRVADEFGEDPGRWRLLMLPFGVFGPFLASVLLSRRNGGGRGGRYA